MLKLKVKTMCSWRGSDNPDSVSDKSSYAVFILEVFSYASTARLPQPWGS